MDSKGRKNRHRKSNLTKNRHRKSNLTKNRHQELNLTKNRQRKLNLTENRPQLSDLPDEILIPIISLIPTSESVAISILLKRLNLWTFITKLDFCDSYFCSKTQFMNFVDTAMILHDRSNLASFSLSCENLGDHAPRIGNWITSAVECNIKDLSLHLSSDILPSSVFSSVFSCESLVKLELNLWSSIFLSPSSISLPNLKYLKLKRISFSDDESTKNLLSHPLLEELDIEWCDWARIKSLIVNVPNLRVLKLHQNKGGRAKVGFSGDNLEYFWFKGLLAVEFYICGCAMKLKEAELLDTFVNPSLEKSMDIMVKPSYNLLSCLSWVHNLSLTEEFLQILERSPELVDRIPVFNCVTKLNLNGYLVRIDSLIIMKIYERCPHLEHLSFMQVMRICVKSSLLHPIPPCFRTHLKKITIVNYRRDFEEEKALGVLLNSAPILKEMVLLYTSPHLCKEYEVREMEAKLIRSPRASKNCRISVVFDYN